jgi:hypothetical protein
LNLKRDPGDRRERAKFFGQVLGRYKNIHDFMDLRLYNAPAAAASVFAGFADWGSSPASPSEPGTSDAGGGDQGCCRAFRSGNRSSALASSSHKPGLGESVPVARFKRMIPSEKRSVRWSSASFLSCSGDMSIIIKMAI